MALLKRGMFGMGAMAAIHAEIRQAEEDLQTKRRDWEAIAPISEVFPEWCNEHNFSLHSYRGAYDVPEYLCTCNPNRYASLGSMTPLPLDLLEELAGLFPGQALEFGENPHGKSVRSTAMIEETGRAHEMRSRQPIFAATLRWNNLHDMTGGPLSLEWVGRHFADLTPRIRFEVQLAQDVSRVIGHQTVEQIRRDVHGREITSCYLRPDVSKAFQTLQFGEWKYRHVVQSWGSGTAGHSGDRQIYWIPDAEGDPTAEPNVVDFVRLLRAAAPAESST